MNCSQAARPVTDRSARPPVAVTSGEPAGIGPDICLALAAHAFDERVVVLGDRDMLRNRALQCGRNILLRDYDRNVVRHHATVAESGAAVLDVLHVPVAMAANAGKLDAVNSPYVLALLDRAMEGCLSGEFAAMVTAPVQKSVINDAGIPFTGHTEYLAQKSGRERVVMMLVGGGMRVALATTHLALRDVAGAITRASLERTLRIIVGDLRSYFGLASPRVVVAGLNPHAGENGYLGTEERDIIEPVLRKLREEGFRVDGPLPADTLFVPARMKSVDCALAMYHDQGLPVLKYASFGAGVNVTLGLPFIRTSVDHGTALDLAGGGLADPGSLVTAIELAVDMAGHREAGGEGVR